MPVPATPIGDPQCPPALSGRPSPPPSTAPCEVQSELTARNSTDLQGNVILSRLSAIEIPGTRPCSLHWQFKRGEHPLDLSTCCVVDTPSTSADTSVSESTCRNSVVFRLREQFESTPCEFDAVIDSAITGEVHVELPASATEQPGVYIGEFAVVDEIGQVVASNWLYVTIARSLWTPRLSGYPPSIAEVRLHLRDTAPGESSLVTGLKFSDEEIAHATLLPIQQWNDTPPHIGRHTTRSFPYRYYWLTAICGYLFRIAAEQFRANNLKYQAGITVDDQDKEVNYEQASDRRLREWVEFLTTEKRRINLAQFAGSYSSSFPAGGFFQFLPRHH